MPSPTTPPARDPQDEQENMIGRKGKGSPPRRDVLTQFPTASLDGLIVRWGTEDDGRLGSSFAAFADRAATTFTGSAHDDEMLLPFLYLYRHAIELDLKHSIRYACRLRVLGGETNESLRPELVAEWLAKQHKHRLMALVDELDRHLVAMGLEKLPKGVRQTFELVSAADPKGEAFRYTGDLPDEQDRIDFPRLAAAVGDAYSLASAAQSMLSQYEDYVREYIDDMPGE